ncbi:5-methyltetrahydropteroyltriglutamate--homocysteine S-methyltransferase [Pseudochrobactrum sp. MP213Fo]|uniref:5-methyltetrahydropteroyltriglutamate-- homocysteine S-methyltransferase n=1 Tax=Pseudochrobactrum sp. MP213Fo TaxID=3022250 RepID=UPI003BA3DC8F
MTVTTANLGFPRIGKQRELKFALESYWAGKTTQQELLATAKSLRASNWKLQQDKGIKTIPSNDFSLYDHVLDLAVTLGVIPAIYGWKGGKLDLDTYFALARGGKTGAATEAEKCGCGHDHSNETANNGVAAQEMTKWFDTNYHYMVPEFSAGQTFTLTENKALNEFNEAKELGIHTRPVLLGPVSFLKLGKSQDADFDLNKTLANLLPVYAEILAQLHAAGADWVQIDEPVLSLDLYAQDHAAIRTAYELLAEKVPGLKILLANYFGSYGDNLLTAVTLPVAGLHLDLVRAEQDLEATVKIARPNLVLSLGVIDGRNIWRGDLRGITNRLKDIIAKRGADTVQIAPSCSLLHVPIDLDSEKKLDQDIRQSLAFAVQKLDELAALGTVLGKQPESAEAALKASDEAINARKASTKVNNKSVQARVAAITDAQSHRQSPFETRVKLQAEHLNLPLYPTTTIGSFPQTKEVRQARSRFTKGELSAADYQTFLEQETETAIRWQEEIGIDVLVHGEFERNDMVQYFGEQLDGYAFTQSGWVQSYGSRYVRPPVIYGDVSRPVAMTVEWAKFSQSKTSKPMKGMLTGPVTMLQWSFVRDDLPRSEVCRQIALALRDEVTDLETAGISVIQIDEPALREGLPLRKSDWAAYLDWAVTAFRLSAAGVRDETQIHTHMCYSEFNDIMPAIEALDADVISIETSRSKMELLSAFSEQGYPNEIGPGVYDIHSPRIPDVEEMVDLIEKAAQKLKAKQIWVNPDCGLKTRGWAETKPALVNMVEAARQLRAAV